MTVFAPERAHLRVFLLVALSLAVFRTASAAQPERFTFGFAPDASTVWRVTFLDEQISDFLGVMDGRHQVTESELRQRFVQDESGQWFLTQVARRIDMDINGERVDNPIAELILGHEIRLRLDENGRAVGYEGFRELMRRYERELDPAVFARVRKSMSVESMGQSEVDKRNRIFDLFAGRTASIGEKWEVLDRVAVQNAWTPVTGTVHFESWTEVDGIAGVKIVYRFDARRPAGSDASAEFTQTVSLRPADWAPTPNNLGASGKYTWIIDPSSGQVLSSVFEQIGTVPTGADPFGEHGEIRKSHTWRWSKFESASN